MPYLFGSCVGFTVSQIKMYSVCDLVFKGLYKLHCLFQYLAVGHYAYTV